MTAEVIEAKPEEKIDEALQKLIHHSISRLPVTGESDVIVGEIHQKDITDRFA